MDKGIYTALSGGIAKGHELELIANNLANVNTPGFKKDGGTFHEYLMELRRPDSAEALATEIKALTMRDGRPPGDKSFVEMDGVYTDYSQGSMRQTGGSLDFAIEGKGFFEVLTPQGVRYTRAGNFSVSPEGVLVNVNGDQVLAAGDQPPEQRVIRLGGGELGVGPDGAVFQNGARVGQIKVQEFQERQWLEKVGNSYFQNINPDNVAPKTTDSLVRQGFLEGSNVDPVSEMTRLIAASRAYEAHMQAIKTYNQIDEKTANEIAR